VQAVGRGRRRRRGRQPGLDPPRRQVEGGLPQRKSAGGAARRRRRLPHALGRRGRLRRPARAAGRGRGGGCAAGGCVGEGGGGAVWGGGGCGDGRGGGEGDAEAARERAWQREIEAKVSNEAYQANQVVSLTASRYWSETLQAISGRPFPRRPKWCAEPPAGVPKLLA